MSKFHVAEGGEVAGITSLEEVKQNLASTREYIKQYIQEEEAKTKTRAKAEAEGKTVADDGKGLTRENVRVLILDSHTMLANLKAQRPDCPQTAMIVSSAQKRLNRVTFELDLKEPRRPVPDTLRATNTGVAARVTRLRDDMTPRYNYH
jgi:hypothetical protein